MGNWRTVNGRPVYITDKGEENPYSNTSSITTKEMLSLKPGSKIYVEQFSGISGKSNGYKSYILSSNNRWSSKDGEAFENSATAINQLNSSKGVVPNIKVQNSDEKQRQIRENEREAKRIQESQKEIDNLMKDARMPRHAQVLKDRINSEMKQIEVKRKDIKDNKVHDKEMKTYKDQLKKLNSGDYGRY